MKTTEERNSENSVRKVASSLGGAVHNGSQDWACITNLKNIRTSKLELASVVMGVHLKESLTNNGCQASPTAVKPRAVDKIIVGGGTLPGVG